MSVIIILLSMLMGGALIIVKSLNMLLGKRIGIYASNLVNHITGIIGSATIYVAVMLTGTLKGVSLWELPVYVFLGGLLGSIFVVLSNYSFSKTTVVTSTVLLLCGQFLSSLAIDIYILDMSVKPTGFIGALLIVCGTILYSIKDQAEKISH